MADSVLIVGATSAIARALAELLGRQGCTLVLTARDREELELLRQDLQIRCATTVHVATFDACDPATIPSMFAEACRLCERGLDGVVVCHGYLPEQAQAEKDLAIVSRTIEVNFTSAVLLLTLAANYLQQRKAGYLAAISSVAGDRGRRSNYIYGASKAGLSVFLQGLDHRLHGTGVRVLAIKPGFVDTPMTYGRLNPDSPLVATPERVARDVVRALRKRKSVVYTPWFWQPIMLIIRLLPRALFNRMRF